MGYPITLPVCGDMEKALQIFCTCLVQDKENFFSVIWVKDFRHRYTSPKIPKFLSRRSSFCCFALHGRQGNRLGWVLSRNGGPPTGRVPCVYRSRSLHNCRSTAAQMCVHISQRSSRTVHCPRITVKKYLMKINSICYSYFFIATKIHSPGETLFLPQESLSIMFWILNSHLNSHEEWSRRYGVCLHEKEWTRLMV